MKVTVLMTCVGGGLSAELIRRIKASCRHDIIVIGTDMAEDATGRYYCDAFYIVPSGEDPMYISRIQEILSSNKVDLIVPTSDEEALALSGSVDSLKNYGATLACAKREVLEIITNKARTYSLLEKSGIAVPAWRATDCLDSLRSAVSEMLDVYDSLVIKPTVQRGSRGVHIVTKSGGLNSKSENSSHPVLSYDELFDLHTISSFASSELIVMEKLVDPVFDLDLLTWHGKCIKSVARRRLDTSRPNSGHIIIKSEQLTSLATQIAKTLDLSWLYDSDVMFDSSGQPYVLEINPRQSGSVATSIAAGIPLFDDLVSLYLGEEVSKDLVPFEKVVRPYTSVHAFDK